MRLLTRLLTAVLITTVLLPISAAEKTRVLMLTQSKGFTHGSVNRQGRELAASEIAMIQLGQTTGLFTVDCTQDAESDMTPENLRNYDIVMFYTTGDLPISEPNREYFLNEWLKQKGHGFIGFHSATDTYHNYKPYWDMVGGTFNGHPWDEIQVHDEFQIKRGAGTKNRNGPKGASHFWYLTPFSGERFDQNFWL
jgi:type 1 glutamine amidotransferase